MNTTLHFEKVNFLKHLTFSKKAVLIADEALENSYAQPLAKELHIELLTLPSGEKAKSKEVKEFIEEKLFQGGYDRDTVLIAMGGGATTDIVGFVASTYLRGISLIFIPTTLLGIVDASIGGKTAVNTSFGKNLLGTFYPPDAILIDLDLLSSLPEKEWFNGLAEILKIALVADSSLWDVLEKNPSSFKEIDLIRKAMERKIDVVEKDPFEKGLRRILNFGHTIGHALEKVSNYHLSHGEAVAIGTLTEAYLSAQMGYLSQEDLKRIYNVYSVFSLRLPQNYSRKELYQALLMDKKKEKNSIRFVLIDQIGNALPFEGAYCSSVSNEALEKSLSWMEKTYG